MSLNEAQLQRLNKDDVIELYMQIKKERDEGLAKVLNEIVEMKDSFTKLEASLVVSKNVSTKLQERVISLERSLHTSEQYSRRECLELVGIPSTIEDNNLENSVCKILNKIEVECTGEDIEACHRIRNNRTIVKFCKRKKANEILRKKSKLKSLNQCFCWLTRRDKNFH